MNYSVLHQPRPTSSGTKKQNKKTLLRIVLNGVIQSSLQISPSIRNPYNTEFKSTSFICGHKILGKSRQQQSIVFRWFHCDSLSTNSLVIIVTIETENY